MDIINALLDWISAHPYAAGAVVFLIAFFESLALVGLFMPGAALMFGVGALVGTGNLPLGPTLVWAASGAIAGDGVSFWLGRRFHQRLRVIWPFRTHPKLITRATGFFYRHGGKSILLGRFVGPIRPVIPAVVGMLEMPPLRFLAFNVISGTLWAPAYVFPGILFAATLGLAAEVATRLSVLLGLMILLVGLVVWGVRRLFRLFHARAHGWILRALEWSRLHPVAGEIPAALLDPEHREAKALTLLALLLVGAAASFLLLLRLIAGENLLAGFDVYLFNTLQELRLAGVDRVMGQVTHLGSPTVLLSVFCVILAWLAFQRRWQAAAHWVAAGAFALFLTHSLGLFLDSQPPQGPGEKWGPFPGAQAAHSLIVYGFLAVLIGRELRACHRPLLYTLAGVVILLIAFSRLYLGAAWFSEVLAGLALGLAWVALLGIAYTRHPAESFSPKWLTGATLATALVMVIFTSGPVEKPASVPAPLVAAEQWWEEGWRDLPAYRSDLRASGAHPLTIQYAGDLEQLAAALEQGGWYSPPPLDMISWMRWFSSRTPVADLPVLPQVHNGHNEALLLVSSPFDGSSSELALVTLRLWPTDRRLRTGDLQLWIGNVGGLRLHTNVAGITVPLSAGQFSELLPQLAQSLGEGFLLKEVRREQITGLGQSEREKWDGTTLLIQPKAAPTTGRSQGSPSTAGPALSSPSAAGAVSVPDQGGAARPAATPPSLRRPIGE